MMKFELINNFRQSKGVLYVKKEHIVSIEKDDDDSSNTFAIYLTNGNVWSVKGDIEECRKELEND